ncbi:MAG: histidyl-tRNA synthetase [Hyphomonadaceae bacterium]|nr:MAG: histidyl-tRNA synthetase [Hyphomonadaceae bacterium]KAF0184861.1 MAG: histidyl-tRNA synthetase [Hyphomonadaceae bacterium]
MQEEKDKKALPPIARRPRGFNDIRVDVLANSQSIISAIMTTYKAWGFEPLETGAMEYSDCLGKFLPDDDRPNAGVFSLQDDDDQWMSLRYDLTAPLARFVAEHWDSLPKPFRRSAAGPVWRNEKPGPGRYREFWQCDADTVGSARPEADAEIIAMGGAALEAAGIGNADYCMKVSNRKLLDGLLQEVGVNVDDISSRLVIMRAIDKLDRLGETGVTDLLGAGRKDPSGDFTHGANLNPSQIDKILAFTRTRRDSRAATLDALSVVIGGNILGNEALEELAKIDATLTSLGVKSSNAEFDPAIVRGLEYYTGTVFETDYLRETKDENGRSVRFGSIGSGGRYDDLVMRFRRERVPATGYSIGVSRLMAALECAGNKPIAPEGPVIILCLDNDYIANYFKMAQELRAGGIAAEVYLGASGMKAQMKYADRRAAPLVVIEGSNEREKGTITLKDLKLGARLAQSIEDNSAWRAERPAQKEVARTDLVAEVNAMLAANK